jgi:hypothetical protein
MSEIRIFTIGIEVHERPDHAEAKALLDVAATPVGLGSGPPQPRRPRPTPRRRGDRAGARDGPNPVDVLRFFPSG